MLQLSGRAAADGAKAEAGQGQYQLFCAGCHGRDGAGMALLGAPPLTQNVWVYGGTLAAVTYTIENGRAGEMPAFEELLGDEMVHVLSAYIYSLNPD